MNHEIAYNVYAKSVEEVDGFELIREGFVILTRFKGDVGVVCVSDHIIDH